MTRALVAVTNGFHLVLAYVVGVPLVLFARLARALRFGGKGSASKVERPPS